MQKEVTNKSAKTNSNWSSTYFGQSTTEERNSVQEKADGAVILTAAKGGGKVTGDHDGITFYYTEIDAREDNFELSATIDVLTYAKNPHDGQEGFGLMARDAIGKTGEPGVMAANIAAVGGFSGGAAEGDGIQLFARSGVVAAEGTGSEGIQKIMLAPGKPMGSHRLTLKKTNSGFTGRVDDGEEAILFVPDILTVQDSRAYVGFFTARLATIRVREIRFAVSKVWEDAPRVAPPPVVREPSLRIVSLAQTPEESYAFRFTANVDGAVTVEQEEHTLAAGRMVAAGEEVALPTRLPMGLTSFRLRFRPEEGQYLSSYEEMAQCFTVERREYSGDIYVSPHGKAAGKGTAASPLDLDTAIHFVKPGQRILLQDGTYLRTAPLEFRKGNDGAADARKYLLAAEGTHPLIDFGRQTGGAVMNGHYWHIKDVDFARSLENTNGFLLGGSHNIIEHARFYENGDTGLQICSPEKEADRSAWPAHNLILNCTSFDNRDPSDNNADGFAAKLRSGEGNVFRGCIAYNNIDDGWDLYTKVGSGAIGAVLIENCIAYHNGFVSTDPDGRGDGNGFKLGGEGVRVPHLIQNSLAFGNLAYGLTNNSNPGVIAVNNIGFDNQEGNISFTTYGNSQPSFKIEGFLSHQQESQVKDAYPLALASEENYFFDGSRSLNKAGLPLAAACLAHLASAPFRRDEEGNIIWKG